jgi:hypothetical protein
MSGTDAVSQIMMPIRDIFNATPDRPIIRPAMADGLEPIVSNAALNSQTRSDRPSLASYFRNASATSAKDLLVLCLIQINGFRFHRS